MLILLLGGWVIFGKIALKWMPLNLSDENSRLIQVMASSKVITWAIVDPGQCRHIASLDHSPRGKHK